MAKKFTSASLSDQELEDLDPWLQDNLGELDEGSFWIIERSEKTGKVEAVMMDENFTSKSRRTIPDEAISTQDSFEEENPAYRTSKPVRQEGERPLRKSTGSSEDDPTVMDETVVAGKRQGSVSNRFSRKNKDFSRPSSVEESRAKSRGETYTPPPAREPRFAEPKREAYKPRFADAKEQPQRKPPKMEEPSARTPRLAAPKREAYKPRFADPVEEEPEAELPKVVDPAAKKPRKKRTTAAASSAFDEMDAEIKAQGPDFQGTVLSQGKMTAKESADLRKKTSRTAPTPAYEAPFVIPAETSDKPVPRWEAMRKAEEAAAMKKDKDKGPLSDVFGDWPDMSPEEQKRYHDDSLSDTYLPPEIDMAGAGNTGAERLKEAASYTVVKKAGAGEETKEKKAGFGFGDYLKAIGGGIKRAVTGDDMPDYIRNPPKNNFAMTLEMPEGMSRTQAEHRAQQAVADHFITNYHPDDIISETSADGNRTTTSFKGNIKSLGSSMSFWMDRKDGTVHINYDPDIIEWTPEDGEKKSPRLR